VPILSYYVYYRVAPGSTAAARDAITQLLSRVSEETGIRGKLLTKRQEPHLWMEVYLDVQDGSAFEHALETHASTLRLEQYLAGGQRFVECFEG